MAKKLIGYTVTASSAFITGNGVPRCKNDSPGQTTKYFNYPEYVAPFTAYYTFRFSDPECGAINSVGIKDSNGKNLSFNNGCFNNSPFCGCAGFEPVNIQVQNKYECDEGDSRIDCSDDPDGFCCIDKSALENLCKGLN
jgi:hypothetical protein